MQVCEVYRLRRETYYLAIDLLDRYLSITHHIQKRRFQLVGITILFISAKLEVSATYHSLFFFKYFQQKFTQFSNSMAIAIKK